MDTATYLIIGGFVAGIAGTVILKSIKLTPKQFFGWMLVLFAGIYIIIQIYGAVEYAYVANADCHKYLGCGVEFFGYDAFEHFFSGLLFWFLILWLCQLFPKYSILHESRWKNFLILVSLSTLFFVLWEIGECLHDIFRLQIVHEPILSYNLRFNLLDQPTNLDTMGDLIFGLLSSIVGFLISL
ncbi:MAG TPA: hypothetical protein VFA52_01645 [Candidatus Paceibacterota bacterium]|nr:hypothetical protein [Candidatus Paceibacterota bacterium]